MPEIMLKATALTKRFGGLKAVSDISLDVHRDEVHAVIGPNGAGKSTLINLLSGDLLPTSGAVLLGSRDISDYAPNRRAMVGIGRSYQKTTTKERISMLSPMPGKTVEIGETRMPPSAASAMPPAKT